MQKREKKTGEFIIPPRARPGEEGKGLRGKRKGRVKERLKEDIPGR